MVQSILLVCPTIYSAGCKLLIVFGQNRLRLDFISGAFFFVLPDRFFLFLLFLRPVKKEVLIGFV